MRTLNLLKLTAFSILLIGSIAEIATAQRQEVGILKGQILDAANAVVIGAEVSAVDVDGKEIRVKSNRSGEFVLNLAPGTYRIRVASPGFAVYEDANVVAAARTTVNLNITLTIAIQESKVTVDREGSISTDPNANASATVLKGKDIKALPDNPAELQAALEALAGPGAGPSGGEIFIDGFSGGKLPRRDTIREIRINQNPFSNEYDRFGLGRIEIFTKPGTEKWTGEVGAEFEDESLNSRNPYSANRPPYQLRNISPEFSGPIIKDRLSFYTDFQIESFENNSLTNANILGPDLVATPFLRSVSAPLKTWEFGQRFDAQITKKVTLTSRYGYETSKDSLAGLGGFDLPSRAYRSNDSEHFLRLTETAVISPTVINETRFQFLTTRSSQAEFDASPTIRVLEAFTGGGSNVGNSFVDRDRIELHNYTSWVKGDHIFRFGGRLRQINVTDSSPSNFAGTFTFTSLDQYRDTILNLSGAFPTQFSISGGQPLAKVKRTDLGIFFQDDWNIDPKLTVSAGLRYESQ
ncbi:MAG: carboxypeptidase regulatory-like domain-containing protein, partial [Pyrinomonadaceae bacterium]